MIVRRRLVFLISAPFLAGGLFFVLRRPPNTLVYKVWEAIPGSVRDSEGRTGQLYRAPHETLELVVFNKGKEARANGLLDRFFMPKPETGSVYLQCTVNLKRLFVGDYYSDEVFRDFLLSRIDGDGWADTGAGLATLKPEGHPNTYVLSNYLVRETSPGYTVKFQVLG